VLNNPLLYTDPSGEFIVGVLVAVAAAVLIKAIHNVANGIPFWHGLGKVAVVTAIQATISFGIGSIVPGPPMAADKLGDALLGSVFNSVMPKLDIKIGNWTITANLSILMGHSYGIGASMSVAFDDGEFFFAAGFGITNFTDYNGMGINGWEYRASAMMGYGRTKDARFTLGTNMWWGMKGLDGESLNQRTGVLGFQSGEFGLMYENDGAPFEGWLASKNSDSHRTAALNFNIKDFTFGFNLFTGKRDMDYENSNLEGGYKGYDCSDCKDSFNRNHPRSFAYEVGPKYRLGALTIGYKGLRIGVNSEKVRHAIQNHAIHNLKLSPFGFTLIDKRQRMFENTSWDWKPYFQYRTPNLFTSW